jgi:hypothetical protein
MNSLVKAAVAFPEFYEQELVATLENRGTKIEIRGDSISYCIGGCLNAAKGWKLDGESLVNFELKFWRLEEDLSSLTLTADAFYGGDLNRPVVTAKMLRELAARVKVKFLRVLAAQQITLVGSKGELR